MTKKLHWQKSYSDKKVTLTKNYSNRYGAKLSINFHLLYNTIIFINLSRPQAIYVSKPWNKGFGQFLSNFSRLVSECNGSETVGFEMSADFSQGKSENDS